MSNEQYALFLFSSGVAPTYSTGICDSVTAGYGKLDQLGYFEFPLIVDQNTYEIICDDN